MELVRFALNLVLDEEKKIESFQKGLHPRIRDRVACLEIKEFTRLVNVATIAGRIHQDYVATREQKKWFMPQVTRFAKRPAIGSSSRQRVGRNVLANQGGQRPICSKYGKMHVGECKSGTRTCFWCGRAYHFVKDFPIASIRVEADTAKARVYAFTPGKADIGAKDTDMDSIPTINWFCL